MEQEDYELMVCKYAKELNNLNEIAKAMGVGVGGNTYREFKRIIEKYNIDTSHFHSVYNNFSRPELKQDEIFCENSRVGHSGKLLKYIKKFAVKNTNVCEKCGRSEWEGKPIPLQVHHLNGKHADNRIENLQILCPNCHALTDNYCGKNTTKRTSKEIIKETGEKLSKKIQKEEEKIKTTTEKLETIKNSGIDFQKWGWVKKAGELVGMTQLHVREFLMKNDPDFYATCYTKEKAIEAVKRRKDSQIKKKEEDKEKIRNRKKIIVEAGIDTSERGWLTKLSKATGINRQTLMDFIKKYMPEMLKTCSESPSLSTPAN